MHHHVQELNSVHKFEYPTQIFVQKSIAIEIPYTEQSLESIVDMHPREKSTHPTKNIFITNKPASEQQ